MDAAAALRPLDEAADAIRRLDEYQGSDDLNDAVARVGAAVDRTLRVCLRNDPSAPEEHRLNALSPDLPSAEVVRSLRARELISLETAGTVHELSTAWARAREGRAGSGDADVARTAAHRLRADLAAAAPAPGSPTPVETAPEDRLPEPEASEGRGNGGDRGPPRDGRHGSGRWMAWVGAGLAAMLVLGLAWVVLGGGEREYDRALTAFRAGRLDSAAVLFERVVEDRPADVSALLYLARSHRRLDRPSEAAAVLRQAAAVDGQDPGVRRELGHLFMDLGRPQAAVAQYEQALEQAPDDPLNWAALIRGLRASGDPRAADLLRDAPPEVRAALGR